ncbi:uncharacterized protein LOC108873108 isoform X2 [Lates calcarifer]|uniref:Uncharacterized protein LOC108873108 isoform X2 n=1 Tax=Lates calcarifer TaxID=8187 RepID=A0AAJ8BIF7_LATCA|nr:uncharacterized protein LOC108873108 isoform X2 [Lates calcarifer]
MANSGQAENGRHNNKKSENRMRLRREPLRMYLNVSVSSAEEGNDEGGTMKGVWSPEEEEGEEGGGFSRRIPCRATLSWDCHAINLRGSTKADHCGFISPAKHMTDGNSQSSMWLLATLQLPFTKLCVVLQDCTVHLSGMEEEEDERGEEWGMRRETADTLQLIESCWSETNLSVIQDQRRTPWSSAV